jgi:hypothetical protein
MEGGAKLLIGERIRPQGPFPRRRSEHLAERLVVLHVRLDSQDIPHIGLLVKYQIGAAAGEGALGDALHGGWQPHGGQACAVLKGQVPDGNEIVGEVDRGEGCAP